MLLWAAVTIQIAALLLLGRHWFKTRQVGFGYAFAAVAFVFHGLAEIAHPVIPAKDLHFAYRYRLFTDPAALSTWAALAGVALAFFVLAYIVTNEKLGRRQVYKKPLALPLFPLLGAAGVAATVALSIDDAGYWLGGLTQQFLIFLLPLCVAAMVQRRPGLHVGLVALTGQTVLLALMGQRTEVIAALAMALFLLSSLDLIKVTRRRLMIAGALGVVAFLAISLTRAEVGRDVFQENVGARAIRLVDGLTSGIQPGTFDDLVYRFDGNAFAARIVQSDTQLPRPGLTTWRNNVMLAVPQAFLPGKLESDLAQRNEEHYLTLHYGLTKLDYLPTHFGTWYATGGSWLLFGLALLVGVGFAFLDRWLWSHTSAWTVAIGLAMVWIIFFYDRGTSTVPITLRGALLLVGFLGVGDRLSGRLPHRGRRRSVAISTRS